MDLENVPARRIPGLLAMNANAPMAKWKKEDLQAAMLAVVERTLDGETIQDMAGEFGIGDKRLYALVAEHAEDAWKSAQIARALMNLDAAEDSLKLATDIVELGVARERIKSAQWQLEKLHRRLFGQDQAQHTGQSVQINIQINREQDQAKAVTSE